MFTTMTCPNCGAQMEVEEGTDNIFCQFCGSRIMNTIPKVDLNQNINITYKQDRSNDSNLIINYASSDSRVLMVTRIVETGQKNTYISGQTLTFRLEPGKHIIVLKIGKINYNRTIYIPDDNTPVKINASYTGKANIWIDQPPYTLPVEEVKQPTRTVQTNLQQQVNSQVALRKSPWSVVAFVLSFLFYTSPIAVVLGVLDLAVFNRKDRDHKLSIAGIAIGAVMTCMMIPIFGLTCASTQKTPDTSTSTWTSSSATTSYMPTTDSSETKEDIMKAIVGTYYGENGSILIFRDDGTCDYFYDGYTKDECDRNMDNEWKYENNKLQWHSDYLLSDIYATLTDSNTSKLRFESLSFFWDDEEYIKISDEPYDYSREKLQKTVNEHMK